MANPAPCLPKPAMEGPDLLVDACIGRHRGAPWLLGCREGVPTVGWTAFALCLLENEICRRLQDTGAAAALPGVCYRRSPTGKQRLIQHRRSHSRHPFEEPLPRGLAGASKVFCLAEPLMLELHHWLLERLVHRYPASPRPRAPKGFAPGSEDETAATTGSSQWRYQMWRGSIRTNTWKPPWDIHPNPGHPSQSRMSILAWDIHPTGDIHPNSGHPSQPGTWGQ